MTCFVDTLWCQHFCCPKNGFITESGRCGLLYYLSDIDYDHHRGPNSNDRDHLVRGLTTDTKDIQNSVFVVVFCPIIDFFSLWLLWSQNTAKNISFNILSLSFAAQQIVARHLPSCPLPKTHYSCFYFLFSQQRYLDRIIFTNGCIVYFYNKEIWTRIFFSWY